MGPSFVELIFLLIILFLVFGATAMPALGESLGKMIVRLFNHRKNGK